MDRIFRMIIIILFVLLLGVIVSGCGKGFLFHTDTQLESPPPNPSSQEFLIARR